ncbi:hypothetical protein ACI789_15615 [Geodermatophilus sp. SYSU D00965]
MRQPSPDTLPRPRDLSDRSDPAVLYVRSYLLIRTAVGLIGILLPLVLIAGESWVRGDGLHVGSSLSSYYHTSMQDVFVGALCIIAVLLATYLAGRPWTWDFWLSLLAGLALLGVVFFPIGQPGSPAGAPRCGSTPTPSGCSPMEQLLGEVRTEHVHLIAAGGCFLLLAALSFLFARRERIHGGSLTATCLHGLCGGVVLLGIAAAALGNHLELDLGPLPLLFASETAATWAFGASWLLAGRDLWLRLLRPRRGAHGAHRADPRRSVAQPLQLVDDRPVVVQPGPGCPPGVQWAASSPPHGLRPDTEHHPWTERWFHGGSHVAVPRPVSDPGAGSAAGTTPGACLPRPRGGSWHHHDLRGAGSTDRPIEGYGVQPVAAASPSEQYEREAPAERRDVAEVARLATLLAASCPDGDRILPRLERWVDVVGLGAHSASSEPWDDVPGQPMWYVGQYMWSWSFSTPWDGAGRTISANLTTFIDADGVPVAPARPGAEFRGSYRPLAEALRKRVEERSARTSVTALPGVREPARERHAATSSALVATEPGASDPHISAHVEQVLGLRLDVLRLTAELDQTREALQRLLYLYDEPLGNGEDRA